MKHIVPKYARLRAGVVGVLGAAALLAACEAKMPTSAEVEAMDVGAAERKLALVLPSKDSIGAYLVDNKEVPRYVAMALKADDVTSVEVVRGKRDLMNLLISTRKAVLKDTAPTMVRRGRGGSSEVIEKKMLQSSPLILIDGVRSTPEAMRALDRTTIQNIDIIKGSAVKAEYPGYTDEELAGGLIRILTKRAGGTR